MEEASVVEILLVEDNPPDAELMVRALRKQRLANRILVVEDGVQALDFLFRRGVHADRPGTDDPKLIMLDMRLPKLSGLEVLRLVKSDDRTRAIPVVMVTSSREDPDIAEAYRLGANSYVVKPVDFEAFQEAIGHIGFYWLLVNQGPS